MLSIRLVLIVAALFGIMLTVSHWACKTDSLGDFEADGAMITNFETHKADFERIVALLAEDSDVIRIGPDFTWLDPNTDTNHEHLTSGISDERLAAYRQIFAKLGLQNGLVRYLETDRVYFFAETKGLLTGGAGKGYVYSKTELSPIFPSLEGLDLTAIEGNRAYRRISDKWYLFVDWE